MNIPWQEIAALALVAIASTYIGWRVWATLRSKKSGSGCGSCGNCSANQTQGKPLVQLEQVFPKR